MFIVSGDVEAEISGFTDGSNSVTDELSLGTFIATGDMEADILGFIDDSNSIVNEFDELLFV